MAVQTDFMMAVNQIAAERGIDVNDVVEAIEQAIRSGFKTYSNEGEEEGSLLNIEIDPEKGTIGVYADKKVVEKVTADATQISLEDAKKIDKRLKVGDHIEVDVTPEGDFGRVAAQSAKQVILQKIREAEKEKVLKEFAERIGDIETGVVQRVDGDAILWEVRKATAYMPAEERVGSEFYRSGARHKILIKEIKTTSKGKQLIVSRADSKFLKGLFELEVPEIVSGSVEIKAVAREAGSRSKVAVISNTEGIDPIGSCVGQKGVRISAIMNELKVGYSEEKIDIILWDDEEIQFIANALSPAEVISVEIKNEKERIVKVIVPDEQLSLAIGKEGQNVRLAAKLTGWKIDIQGETIKIDNEDLEKAHSEVKEKMKTVKPGSETGLAGLGLENDLVIKLEESGIESVVDLSQKISEGKEIEGITEDEIEKIKESLKDD